MSEELYPMIAGETVTVRPIRKSDVDMERDFIRGLSPDSKHFRFLGGVSELTPDELKRLCNVDGNHTMAFVATVRRADRELEIGVSRYAQDSEADVREIAITVADEWQHKGLGLELMRPSSRRQKRRESGSYIRSIWRATRPWRRSQGDWA